MDLKNKYPDVPSGQYPDWELEAAAKNLEQYKAELLAEERKRTMEQNAKEADRRREEKVRREEEERAKSEERGRLKEEKLAAKRESIAQDKEQRKVLVQQQRDARRATQQIELESQEQAARQADSAAKPKEGLSPEIMARNKERVKQRRKALADHSKLGRAQYRLEQQQRIDAFLREKEAARIQQGKKNEIVEASEDLEGQSRTVQGQRKQDEKADEIPAHSRDRSRGDRDRETTPQAGKQANQASDNHRGYQAMIEQWYRNQDRLEEEGGIGKGGDDPELPLLKHVNEPGSASLPSPNRIWSGVVDSLDDASKQFPNQLSAAARQGLAGVPSIPNPGFGANGVAVP